MSDDIIARLRETMKAKARDLPYMSKDVEFFGVTDDEWTELLGVVIAPLRDDLAAARELLKEALDYIDDPYDWLAIQIGAALKGDASE